MKKMTIVVLVICAMAFLFGIQESSAGSKTLTLLRDSSNSVDDAGGLTIYDGGRILQGATQVGYYSKILRTVIGGTLELNQSLVTINLMFFKSGGIRPTENIIIQGVHWFGSGEIKGGVSAASSKYAWIVGASAYAIPVGTSEQYTLTLTYFGTGSMSLP